VRILVALAVTDAAVHHFLEARQRITDVNSIASSARTATPAGTQAGVFSARVRPCRRDRLPGAPDVLAVGEAARSQRPTPSTQPWSPLARVTLCEADPAPMNAPACAVILPLIPKWHGAQDQQIGTRTHLHEPLQRRAE
jgi:hypothetical protein